jgi:hypothetical protein
MLASCRTSSIEKKRSSGPTSTRVGLRMFATAALASYAVLGLESVRDAAGNIIRKAPLPVWANLRQQFH